jgi:hypothetical protein
MGKRIVNITGMTAKSGSQGRVTKMMYTDIIIGTQ